MTDEIANEDAQNVIMRLRKLVEQQCGPIFISKTQMRDLADLYRRYKKEYGLDFAAEEIKDRIKSHSR